MYFVICCICTQRQVQLWLVMRTAQIQMTQSVICNTARNTACHVVIGLAFLLLEFVFRVWFPDPKHL